MTKIQLDVKTGSTVTQCKSIQLYRIVHVCIIVTKKNMESKQCELILINIYVKVIHAVARK